MIPNFVQQIKKRSLLPNPPTISGRSGKWEKINFDDLVFVPAQLAKRPVDYFRDKISSETIVGKKSKKPIKLKTPVIIGAMSFGALSDAAKIALAKASKIVGTFANTGEGGMLTEERKEAEFLIAQFSTGRFGVNEEYLKSADAIEVKIGQGAKPGQGGLLPAEKVTDKIAQVRGVEKGLDVHSPPYHKDIKNINDLKVKISWLRKLTEGKPIILKLGAGDIETDIKLAVQANPDIISIDGIAGGTGAAPEVMLEEVGIPTLAALVRARKTLDKLKAKQELWVGGGLTTGGDVAKALALGADAIFMGTPMMIAMGCVYCRQCFKGNCPLGIATQDQKLVEKLDSDKAAKNIVNYISSITEEAKMIAGACGYDSIQKLSVKDLRALDPVIAQIAGVKMV